MHVGRIRVQRKIHQNPGFLGDPIGSRIKMPTDLPRSVGILIRNKHFEVHNGFFHFRLRWVVEGGNLNSQFQRMLQRTCKSPPQRCRHDRHDCHAPNPLQFPCIIEGPLGMATPPPFCFCSAYLLGNRLPGVV